MSSWQHSPQLCMPTKKLQYMLTHKLSEACVFCTLLVREALCTTPIIT